MALAPGVRLGLNVAPDGRWAPAERGASLTRWIVAYSAPSFMDWSMLLARAAPIRVFGQHPFVVDETLFVPPSEIIERCLTVEVMSVLSSTGAAHQKGEA